MGDREQRVGYNEVVFREVNERVSELEEHFESGRPLDLICECGDSACTERVQLYRDEYEAIRAEATRFLIVPGHDVPGAERIVSENDRFVVVEKQADAAAIAEKFDPREDDA
jgi:hypothetical protein